MPKLILASQSPQRRDMLASTDLPFKVIPAHIDEAAVTASTQFERAQKVATAKAQAVAQAQIAKGETDFVVVAGDTYVVDPKTDRALEKPRDLAEAREMLQFQSGREVIEYTGVCFLRVDSKGKVTSESETIWATVLFRKLSQAEIERYVTTEPVTTWSAAFCPAYTTGAALIAEVSGSYTCFSHGFPTEWFVPRLQKVFQEV